MGVGKRNLNGWLEIVQCWARREPLIRRAFLFGSYAKGLQHEGSDLDIALDVEGRDESERLANSICFIGRWRSELEASLDTKLDLQTMADDDLVVTPAVIEHGILIYSRSEGR